MPSCDLTESETFLGRRTDRAADHHCNSGAAGAGRDRRGVRSFPDGSRAVAECAGCLAGPYARQCRRRSVLRDLGFRDGLRERANVRPHGRTAAIHDTPADPHRAALLAGDHAVSGDGACDPGIRKVLFGRFGGRVVSVHPVAAARRHHAAAGRTGLDAELRDVFLRDLRRGGIGATPHRGRTRLRCAHRCGRRRPTVSAGIADPGVLVRTDCARIRVRDGRRTGLPGGLPAAKTLRAADRAGRFRVDVRSRTGISNHGF